MFCGSEFLSVDGGQLWFESEAFFTGHYVQTLGPQLVVLIWRVCRMFRRYSFALGSGSLPVGIEVL